MKENNKFSLSAFFCSLGSKSKIFMFFLLGVPFFLVQLFTLNIYAMPAPVIPEGFSPEVIPGNSAISSVIPNIGDPYVTTLLALGFDPTDPMYIEFQMNSEEMIQALINAYNNKQLNLGDRLKEEIDLQYNTQSQNGYLKNVSLSRDLWEDLNKATKSGLDLRIENQTDHTYESFVTFLNAHNIPVSSSNSDLQNLYNQSVSNGQPCNVYNVVFGYGDLSSVVCVCDGEGRKNGDFFELIRYSSSSGYIKYDFNGLGVSDSIAISPYQFYNIGSSGTVTHVGAFGTTVTNKHLGIASDFISNKANESYDVLSKSSSINPNNGKIEGPVTYAVISPSQLQQLQDLINQGQLSLAEALNRLGLSAYDNNSGILIDSNIDPASMQAQLAQAQDPAPTAPWAENAFHTIDNWVPVAPVPDSDAGNVMNWVAAQMQIVMTISQFHNVWLSIATLAIAVILLGITRLWN